MLGYAIITSDASPFVKPENSRIGSVLKVMRVAESRKFWCVQYSTEFVWRSVHMTPVFRLEIETKTDALKLFDSDTLDRIYHYYALTTKNKEVYENVKNETLEFHTEEFKRFVYTYLEYNKSLDFYLKKQWELKNAI